jgi:hypothetical protein
MSRGGGISQRLERCLDAWSACGDRLQDFRIIIFGPVHLRSDRQTVIYYGANGTSRSRGSGSMFANHLS